MKKGQSNINISKQMRLHIAYLLKHPHAKVRPRLDHGMCKRDYAKGWSRYMQIGRANA